MKFLEEKSHTSSRFLVLLILFLLDPPNSYYLPFLHSYFLVLYPHYKIYAHTTYPPPLKILSNLNCGTIRASESIHRIKICLNTSNKSLLNPCCVEGNMQRTRNIVLKAYHLESSQSSEKDRYANRPSQYDMCWHYRSMQGGRWDLTETEMSSTSRAGVMGDREVARELMEEDLSGLGLSE